MLRWLADFRALVEGLPDEGRTAPLRRGHAPPALDEKAMRRLDALVEEQPDRTLAQLRQDLGVLCSLVAIHHALEHFKFI